MPTGEAVQQQEMTSFDQPGGMGLGNGDHIFEHADVKWRSVIVKKMQLSRMTVICMIFNRMIGKACSAIHPLEVMLTRIK